MDDKKLIPIRGTTVYIKLFVSLFTLHALILTIFKVLEATLSTVLEATLSTVLEATLSTVHDCNFTLSNASNSVMEGAF